MTLKMKTLVKCAGILSFIGLVWTAQSQTNSNGLEVSGRAALLTDTNSPRLFLTLELLNTSEHEVTVLTKNLNVGVEPSGNSVALSLGYLAPTAFHPSRAGQGSSPSVTR
jgi:hypothetical protein